MLNNSSHPYKFFVSDRKMPKTYLLFVVIVVASQMVVTYGKGGGSCYAHPFVWGSECRYVYLIYYYTSICVYIITER